MHHPSPAEPIAFATLRSLGGNHESADMQLQLGTGPNRQNPSAEQVADALRRLPRGQDSFAVLLKSEQVYMQTIGSSREGFDLEFRDGSEAAHFKASAAPLSLEAVTEVFHLYLAEDPQWRTRVPEPAHLHLPDRGGSGRRSGHRMESRCAHHPGARGADQPALQLLPTMDFGFAPRDAAVR